MICCFLVMKIAIGGDPGALWNQMKKLFRIKTDYARVTSSIFFSIKYVQMIFFLKKYKQSVGKASCRFNYE